VCIAAGIFFALILALVFTTKSQCEFMITENATETGENACTTTTITGINFWLNIPLAAVGSYLVATLGVLIIKKCCDHSFYKD
jgi:hypothetical protein